MESLPIQGHILSVSSGDAYTEALQRNSDLSVLPAKYVVQPIIYEDIPPVISYATSQSPPLEIAVKGGGAHSSTWASSDGGVVVDLRRLNKVTISKDRKSITVQGGALWGEVYEVTAPAHLDVVGSSLWFIGVGGFTLGGGYGPLSGQYGLAIDNLLSVTVVLADGRILKASSQEESDLFWAIRGGGGQFGIVVDFTFKVYEASGPIGAGMIAYPGSELASVLKIISHWKKTQTPRERFGVTFSRPAPHFKPAVVIIPTIFNDHEGKRSQEILASFREGDVQPILYKIGQVPDMLAVSHAADANFKTAPRALTTGGTVFSDFFPELLIAVWEKWVEFTEANEDVRASTIMWDLTSPETITKVPSFETAHKNREPHFCMAVQGRSTTKASIGAARNFTTSIVSFIRNKNTELSGKDLGWSLNLTQGYEDLEDVFGTNLPRLREIKAEYDPKKVWSKGLLITPRSKRLLSVL